MPVSPREDDAYWDQKLTELRRGQLDTVQKAATGWSALFAAVLGVFGTVAFAGGLTSLDKLETPWDLVVKIATYVAVFFALVATIQAARAAQGSSPKLTSKTDAASLRDETNANATTALGRLRIAKWSGAIAALIVIAGSSLVLALGEAEKPSEPPDVFAIVSGEGVCGKLDKDKNGDLMLDGTVLTDVSSLTVVTKCP